MFKAAENVNHWLLRGWILIMQNGHLPPFVYDLIFSTIKGSCGYEEHLNCNREHVTDPSGGDWSKKQGCKPRLPSTIHLQQVRDTDCSQPLHNNLVLNIYIYIVKDQRTYFENKLILILFALFCLDIQFVPSFCNSCSLSCSDQISYNPAVNVAFTLHMIMSSNVSLSAGPDLLYELRQQRVTVCWKLQRPSCGLVDVEPRENQRFTVSLTYNN